MSSTETTWLRSQEDGDEIQESPEGEVVYGFRQVEVANSSVTGTLHRERSGAILKARRRTSHVGQREENR